MTVDHKPSNPKDVVGAGKLPLELIPDSAINELSLACLEGALKYGRFNWRIAGVRSSIYVAALRRHLAKWWNGEDSDDVTHVHHLASVMACAAIIIDAALCDKLNDDRPPAAPVSDQTDGLARQVEHLKSVFADHNPHQYTIKDTQKLDRGAEDVTQEEADIAASMAEWRRQKRKDLGLAEDLVRYASDTDKELSA